MNPDSLFQTANTLALFAWIFLIIAHKWRWTFKLLIGIIVTALGLLYAYFISKAMTSGMSFESFGSLDGIVEGFQNKQAALAGWIHYLAFDLMVGIWIVYNASKNQIPFLLILPCLLGTFMLGPVGLLLYLVIRMIAKKSFFVNYP